MASETEALLREAIAASNRTTRAVRALVLFLLWQVVTGVVAGGLYGAAAAVRDAESAEFLLTCAGIAAVAGFLVAFASAIIELQKSRVTDLGVRNQQPAQVAVQAAARPHSPSTVGGSEQTVAAPQARSEPSTPSPESAPKGGANAASRPAATSRPAADLAAMPAKLSAADRMKLLTESDLERWRRAGVPRLDSWNPRAEPFSEWLERRQRG